MLDDAVADFNHAPTDNACAKLLRVATEYHKDDMISDGTYYNYVERVAEWLADE